MIRIKVPATTANFGPGFDAVGIALNLYNTFKIEKSDSGQKVVWESEEALLPLEKNLVYTTILAVLKKYGREEMGFNLYMSDCAIPISRGLGSSAAAIVGGIYGANHLMDDMLDVEVIIDLATALEGHPDNVVPAILGGMVISIMDEDKVIHSTVNFPEDVHFNVMVPDFKLSTEKARAVLPTTYKRQDCISNISRIGLLVNAIHCREYDKFRYGLVDKIHEPYRIQLIENGESILKKSEEYGALGEFISGAGPTLIALTHKDNDTFQEQMKDYLAHLSDHWSISKLTLNDRGVEIEVIQ